MDAALESGAIVYSNSQAVNGSCNSGCITGGTSLSSPLAAGAWARCQNAHGNKLGFAAIRFYRDFSTHSAGSLNAGPPPWQPDGGFHDLVSGSNGLYTAAPGYDYTTGLGSFDISVMNGEI
jgi:subtilase family serine protease